MSASGGEPREYFSVVWKPSLFVFGEDQLAVHDDVVDAPAPSDELGVEAACLPDCGRQTGGPGEIVSARAVGDADLHVVPLAGWWKQSA